MHIHAYVNIYVYLHMYTHTHTHTHTHTMLFHTQVSGYSTGATLLQAISPGDNTICVSSAASLFGARKVATAAPYTTGDPSDVIMWIKIGDSNLNPAGMS